MHHAQICQIDTRAEIDPVGAGTVSDCVGPIARRDLVNIVAGIADHAVVACATDQHIVTGAAIQRIVARAAGQRVIPCLTQQVIITALAVDHIVPGGAVAGIGALASACQ